MDAALVQVAIFIISTIANIYLVFVMFRFLLQLVKADFYNPYCQMLIKITNPLLRPLRRIIPGLFGIDIASIVLMLLIQLIALSLIGLLVGFPINVFILVATVFRLLILFCNLLFFVVIVRAIASWFNPSLSNPLFVLLFALTEPLLRPIRRIIPVISGFDFSPIIVLILLQVVVIFISSLGFG